MSNQCHYMKSPEGRIEKVNLNDWAKKRRAGWTFSNESDYQAQQNNATPDRDDVDVVPTMDNTKAELLEYARANGIDANRDDTKAEILFAIEG